jgi:peroxiredoxin
MRRWSANTWVLIFLGGIILLTGVDVGRRIMAGDVPGASPAALTHASFDPDFAVGDAAPDFTLPNAQGQSLRLSELRRGPTVLTFSCGCAYCKETQRYLGKLTSLLGDRAPVVVTVTTSAPEAEDAWTRDTGLVQTTLYEETNGPVMQLYKGHPCPRVFGIDAEGRIDFIGSSPGQMRDLHGLLGEMSRRLGFQPTDSDEDEGLPKAPEYDFPMELRIIGGDHMPTMPVLPPGATQPTPFSVPGADSGEIIGAPAQGLGGDHGHDHSHDHSHDGHDHGH